MLVTNASQGLDGGLLRALFDRDDRSAEDRRWLIETAGSAYLLEETVASPHATVDDVKLVLHQNSDAIGPIAKALLQRPDLAGNLDLRELAVDVIGQLDDDYWYSLADRWPPGHPVPEELVQALLASACRGSRRQRGFWEKPVSDPAGDRWRRLWDVVQTLPVPSRTEAAQRHPRVQAVLLEYGEALDEKTLSACVPVLDDPDLGGEHALTQTGRLATMLRWAGRHERLRDLAAPAFTRAAREAVRALGGDEGPELAAQLVVFAPDPGVLGDAVERIASAMRTRILLDEDSPVDLEARAREAGEVALTLATCAHTPEAPLRAALPWISPAALHTLPELRPALAEACKAEQLARVRSLGPPRPVEPLATVPDDAELAADGDPVAALTGFLFLLPNGDRYQRARLAVEVLRSCHVDASVLRGLPAETVLAAPWHTELAAAMMADACGDDPDCWQVLRERTGYAVCELTFGGLLAEIEDYKSCATRSDVGGIAYRYCHACQLTTPLEPPARPEDGMPPTRQPDGWRRCRLCGHAAPPASAIDYDAARDCPDCGHRIEHPDGATIIACGGCDQMFFHPQLPGDLRPRVEAVLAERRRIATLVGDLSRRIEESTGQHRRANHGADEGTHSHLSPGWFEDRDDARPGQFRTAFATAIRRTNNDRQRQATQLRFGLGRARRVLTSREIASRVGCRPAQVPELVRAATTAMHAATVKPQPARLDAYHRACRTAAHIADRVMADAGVDFSTAVRIRGFLDHALPNANPAAGVRLLLRLSGFDRRFNSSQVHSLTMMVTAVEGNYLDAATNDKKLTPPPDD
jgi:hypothetical protein